tara:strand:+ start:154 stop:300 length:147 start_codon:yes stop_codon:yes gene_type:complete
MEREPWSKIIKEHQVLIGSVLIATSILIVGFNIAEKIFFLEMTMKYIK